MADSSSTLVYEPNAPSSCDLQFEERDGTCRLTFPAPAAWIGWASIAFALAGAAGQLAIIWMLVRQFAWISSYNATLPPGVPPIPVWSPAAIGGLLMYSLYALIWTGSAVFHYLALRRQWRIPKFLEAGPDGLTYQQPTLIRRYRHWPAADVLGVDIQAVRSVIPRHRVVQLVIKVHVGRTLRVRFTGQPKIASAERFAARAKEILLLSKPLPLEPNLG